MAQAGGHGACWAGFDLGGTKMMAAIYDGRFRDLARERKKTKPSEGFKPGIERMVRTIQDGLAAAGVKPGRLRGIGLGCPGPVDMKRGIVLEAPNLGWTRARVRDAMEQAFKCRVVVANDVDAGLFGEYMFGAARGARCAVGIFPGTGIGGACIYEGRILRGSVYSCMEIGHIPVQPEGPVCGCGRRGCLEALASRLAVAAAAALASHRGKAPCLQRCAGADVAAMRSGTLAESLRAGDKAVAEIVLQSARWLGRGIATVVNLLAPDAVILGGGLVEAMPRSYIEEAERTARSLCMSTYRNCFKVKRASLGDDAVVLGAAALAEQAES